MPLSVEVWSSIDSAAFAGSVAGLEDDYDPQSLVLNPSLQLAQLALQFA